MYNDGNFVLPISLPYVVTMSEVWINAHTGIAKAMSHFAKIDVDIVQASKSTVDSRYLEIEGTLKNSSRYPYFDISDL